MKNKLPRYMQHFVDQVIYEDIGKYTVYMKDKYAYEVKTFTATSFEEVKEKLRDIIPLLIKRS